MPRSIAPATKPFALLFHLGLDLLAHGAAQQVGPAERIAGQDLRDLHHLFLVDHDAVGFLQDRLEHRMQIVRLFVAMLAGAVGRDVLHRAGPIERDQRDDVLEPVGPHVDQRAPHALAFNLEHADRVAARQHLVTGGIVERQRRQIELDAAPPEQLHRDVKHGQRLEAEEVEFHQSRGFDPFHVELGHRHVGFRDRDRAAPARSRAGRRSRCRRHGSRRGGSDLRALRDVEGARHHRVLVAKRLQLRLAVDRRGQRHRGRGILGTSLVSLSTWP